jgi:predicted lipoprotein with Yx(FWY)xxD motif
MSGLRRKVLAPAASLAVVTTTGEGREMLLGLHLQDDRHPRRGRHLAALTAVAAGIAVAAVLAGIALAAGGPPTVGSASSSKLGERIVVDGRGRTLYALSPETVHHLLCTGECFTFWPPLTVSSRKVRLRAGHGVHGRLGILRRSDGLLQVTLGGLPLYRYAGDRAKGQANGQGIRSFGGTWHVVAAGDPSHAPATSAPGSGTPGTETNNGHGGYESPPANTTGTPTTSTPTSTNPGYPKEEPKKEEPKKEEPKKEEPKEKSKEEPKEKSKEEPWY